MKCRFAVSVLVGYLLMAAPASAELIPGFAASIGAHSPL